MASWKMLHGHYDLNNCKISIKDISEVQNNYVRGKIG
jgi:hypothetical protein